MKKVIAIVLALALLATISGVALAGSNSQPASKATAKVGYIEILDSGDMDWTTILEQDIKTPNGKDLFIDVSLECGLYTLTKGKSKSGDEDTSVASAMIKVRVLVDDSPVYPAEVIFNARTQTLTVKFAGYFEEVEGELVLTEEELELILDTMSANSFNFIIDDLTSGVHTIEVQAMIDTEALYEAGYAEAKATIGNGSVTIELVRMIKDEDIELE